MEQPIVGFHKDDEDHWVVCLACGHNQHVRHDPPWINRLWVTTPEGRESRLGVKLDCKKCEEGVGDHRDQHPRELWYERAGAFSDGSGAVAPGYRVIELVFMLGALGPVLVSAYVSFATGEGHWFQRSGPLMVLFSVAVEYHRRRMAERSVPVEGKTACVRPGSSIFSPSSGAIFRMCVTWQLRLER